METLCAGELEYKWYLRKVVSNISKSQPMKCLFRVCFKRFSFVGSWPMGPLQKGYCDALGPCRQDWSCLPAHTLSCDKGSRREDEARAPRRGLCIHFLESPRLPPPVSPLVSCHWEVHLMFWEFAARITVAILCGVCAIIWILHTILIPFLFDICDCHGGAQLSPRSPDFSLLASGQ